VGDGSAPQAGVGGNGACGLAAERGHGGGEHDPQELPPRRAHR